ncbi:MAG: DAK2 domain-containing protein [Coriobacteriales bacterium]|jgi:DAK2 domain fusion protein YloV|nr:DAK2 domain-containing protein [Coriobacteriales bacterium]
MSQMPPLALAACSYVSQAARALHERVEEINRLNVFPVPDGDTGTNMSLTLQSVVKELEALPAEASLEEVRKAITHGSLMGARGNSGVITSQIFRGACEGLADAEEFDSTTVALAAMRAVEVAFNAVRKPVEGTILTVLKDCANAAAEAAEEGLDLVESLQRISTEAMASVRRTPELLPVLKDNGVVDAGGYGLALLLEGFTAAVSGNELTPMQTSLPVIDTAPKVAIEQINDWEDSDYLYCTEFLFNATDLSEADARDFLGSLGDCELLVGASPHYKVHVHTNEPGSVLSYMTERGQVAEVHIHNMQEQSVQRLEGLQASPSGAFGAPVLSTSTQDSADVDLGKTGTILSWDAAVTEAGSPLSSAAGAAPKPFGYVAVCSGAGTAKLLRSQGVDVIVSGGQTMNPATKDFVDAINAVNAEAVIIFPNNKNVILAANAAVSSADKPAAVVPTTSVLQSFSALLAADDKAELEENIELMTEAISQVRSGEITTAIKDAKTANGTAIKAGDVIGLADGSLEVVGQDVITVSLELIALISTDADVLTLLAGQDLDQTQFEVLLAQIEQRFDDLEVDPHRGEQPLYPLIMSAE